MSLLFHGLWTDIGIDYITFFHSCGVQVKMASGFTFGFSGDDVDIDESEPQFDGGDVQNQNQTSRNGEESQPLVEAKRWDGEEWVCFPI